MKELSLNFAFLLQPAGFDIGDALIAFQASDAYWRAFVVGLLNTLLMALTAGISAMLLGVVVGVGLVVSNRTSRGALNVFVELMRNLPKLLLLLAIYILMVNTLPAVADAFHPLPGVYLSNRGLALPAFDFSAGGFSFPEIDRFSFQGGCEVQMQFVALWLTLTIYHGAQIGEIVRGGLQAIPKGQWEAAIALGLPLKHRLRRVILPQVMQQIIPSLISQFINLLKNTSIGLAVGFTDLMAVASTTINQAFKPVEVMLLIMLTYLGIGVLLASAFNALTIRLRKGLR
ncbi:MAG: ABC transporter permease subunit [Rhodoferax sp.]